MLKRILCLRHLSILYQPPSGGCVLKPVVTSVGMALLSQPPSGGCVLKQKGQSKKCKFLIQPPSGGCVLKRNAPLLFLAVSAPAAFGRLCVETHNLPLKQKN